MEVFVATAREKQLLQWMLSNLRNQRQNAPLRGVEETPDNAPDVYIAKLNDPQDHIQPLSRDYISGTGTGSGIGPGVEDLPSYSLCDLYRIVVSDGTPGLVKVREKERVYNISSVLVTDDWFHVARTKFGQWVVLGQSDRWEFGVLEQDATEGEQPAGIFSSITKGPSLGNPETGERVEVNYVQGGDLSSGDVVTLMWKWGKVYAIPWDCPTAAGTGSA